MLVGAQHAGFTSFGSNHNEDCGSQLGLAAGGYHSRNGDNGIILSKTSLTPGQEYGDPSTFVDFFNIGVGAASVRSRVSPCCLGEPATPNGAGDSGIPHSPVSSSHAGRGYTSGRNFGDMIANDSPDSVNFARRWCAFAREDAPAYGPTEAPHSAPMLGSRHSRFLKTSQENCPELTSGLATAPFIDSLIAKAHAADVRARALERQLSDQRAASRVLERQVQERDEQIVALRSELRQQGRLEQAHRASDAAAAQAAESDLHAQLQRPSGESFVHEQDTSSVEQASSAGDAGVETESARAMPPSTMKLLTLLRLDTPQAHDALPTLSSFSAERLAMLTTGSPPQTTEQAPDPQQHTSDDGSPANSGIACVDAPDASPAAGSAARGPSSRLHPLLAVEVRRTDRAHAALLCSSRQAQRLSQQLVAMRAHAAALHEELYDWRSACLDNHRQLARLRRAAAGGTQPLQ